MSELRDIEAGKRYGYVADKGKEIFAGSALLNPTKSITRADIDLISRFHHDVSPVNPRNPWRLIRENRSIEKGHVADSSVYANWESPGGALEHIELACKAAESVTRKLALPGVDPLKEAVAAALHDEGREVTHLFYITELIGRSLLRSIGIREDIISIMPDESLMLLPWDQNMNDAVMNLSPEAVIVRIADEFGKRVPGTDRIYQPEDYDAWDRQTWAESYANRPVSGRPSDLWWRTQRQLHVDNVPRYFRSLDNWVRSVSSFTLKELTTQLDQELSSQLPKL